MGKKGMKQMPKILKCSPGVHRIERFLHFSRIKCSHMSLNLLCTQSLLNNLNCLEIPFFLHSLFLLIIPPPFLIDLP